MHSRFSRRSSPLLFDPEIEKTALQNLLLRSALKDKAVESTMNPQENQSNPNQQTPQQEPLPEMPPMPPPPFITETQTQTQQTPPITPQPNTTTQPISFPTGDFHVIGGPFYPLENLQPLQTNPLRVVNQLNQVPHPNRSSVMFELRENRARADTWDNGYGDEDWGINDGYMGYRGGLQNLALNRNQPVYQQR
ncbi:hypothetical protein Hanom_Chr09g00817571 [Helianthus anomalus]